MANAKEAIEAQMSSIGWAGHAHTVACSTHATSVSIGWTIPNIGVFALHILSCEANIRTLIQSITS